MILAEVDFCILRMNKKIKAIGLLSSHLEGMTTLIYVLYTFIPVLIKFNICAFCFKYFETKCVMVFQ